MLNSSNISVISRSKRVSHKNAKVKFSRLKWRILSVVWETNFLLIFLFLKIHNSTPNDSLWQTILRKSFLSNDPTMNRLDVKKIWSLSKTCLLDNNNQPLIKSRDLTYAHNVMVKKVTRSNFCQSKNVKRSRKQNFQSNWR